MPTATRARPAAKRSTSKNGASAPTNGQAPETPALNREEAAERIYEMLTDEPQTMAGIRRRLKGADHHGGIDDVTVSAMGVLEAQHRAMRAPNPTTGKDGWVLYDANRLAVIEHPQQVEFPYKWAMVKVDQMFIDPDYQRPLTTFVARIQARFNPVLFGVLVLSDRGTRNKKRYAVIDGQSRWVAASRLKIGSVPCIVFSGLTPQAEADMFARLQKERRGMATYHRFRADLTAQRPEALAIRDLAESAGFRLGVGQGELKAIAALEKAYRQDDFELERALSNLHVAWPEIVPEDVLISGMHYFLTHFPIGKRERKDINDEVLVQKIQVAGIRTLKSRMEAIKDSGVKGTNGKRMGMAIENTYLKK